MPIVNIVDRRKRQYRFKKINAIVEAAWHDNSLDDADQVASPAEDGPNYAQMEHVALSDAVTWADSFAWPVTLFLYDEDDGIYVTPHRAPPPAADT
jgi:hypothetical protein